MITFETSEEKHVNGIVRELNALYDGQPVGSIRIGEAYGMKSAQVLNYLHKARDRGLATPVLSSAKGTIRGWVPAHAGPMAPLAEQHAILAADAVKALSSGSPVSSVTIGEHLDVSSATAVRWLRTAERMKLVRRLSSPQGWMLV